MSFETPPKRILLYGGSFNPIHHAHLRMALECYLSLDFNEVWFIPNFQSPLKNQPKTAADHRVAMLELVLERYPMFDYLDIEMTQGKACYTVDTVSALQQQYPEAHFAWLIGQDALNQFDHWREWQKLIDMLDWVVVQRPGYQAAYSAQLAPMIASRVISSESYLAQKTSDNLPQYGKIVEVVTTHMAISSTTVRQIAQQKQPCDFLVPEEVSRYIHTHRLYQ